MVQEILLGFWLLVTHDLWVLVDECLVAENHGWCELGVGTPCKHIVVVEDVSVTGDVELQTYAEMIVA